MSNHEHDKSKAEEIEKKEEGLTEEELTDVAGGATHAASEAFVKQGGPIIVSK